MSSGEDYAPVKRSRKSRQRSRSPPEAETEANGSTALILLFLVLSVIFAVLFVVFLSLYLVDHNKITNVDSDGEKCKVRCALRTSIPTSVTAVKVAQLVSGFVDGQSVAAMREVVMPGGATCLIAAMNKGPIYQSCGGVVTLFADYSSITKQQNPPLVFGEAGMGGIEFDPDFQTNGRYWIVVTTFILPINTTAFAIQSPETLSCNRTTWPGQNTWDGTISTATSGSGLIQELRQYTYVPSANHTFDGLLLTWYGLVSMHMGYDSLRYHRNSLLLSMGEMLWSISMGQLAVGLDPERFGGKIWKIDLALHPGPTTFSSVPVRPQDLPPTIYASLTMLAIGGRNLAGVSVDTNVVSCGDYFAHTMNGQDTSDMGYAHIALDKGAAPLPNFGWPYWEGRVAAARRDVGLGCNTSFSSSPGYVADRFGMHRSGGAIDLLNHHRPFVAFPSRSDMRVGVKQRIAGITSGVLFRGFGAKQECPLFVAASFLTRTEVNGVMGFNDPDVFAAYGYTRGIGDIRVAVPPVLDTQYEVPYTRHALHGSLLNSTASAWGSNGLTQVTTLAVSLDGNHLYGCVSQTGGSSATREVAIYKFVFA